MSRHRLARTSQRLRLRHGPPARAAGPSFASHCHRSSGMADLVEPGPAAAGIAGRGAIGPRAVGIVSERRVDARASAAAGEFARGTDPARKLMRACAMSPISTPRPIARGGCRSWCDRRARRHDTIRCIAKRHRSKHRTPAGRADALAERRSGSMTTHRARGNRRPHMRRRVGCRLNHGKCQQATQRGKVAILGRFPRPRAGGRRVQLARVLSAAAQAAVWRARR